MHDSRVPTIGAVMSLERQLLEWLSSEALPLWDEHGVDRISGGYFEQMTFDADRRVFEAMGPVRRGRVVARQIYVFETGRRLGWVSERSNPVRHGCDYLFGRMHVDNGVFHTAIDSETNEPAAPFSLYEHAFYLFALAQVNGLWGDEFPVEKTAAQSLDHLWLTLARKNGGFDESVPPTAPLKSNPHMHLLEAALAWIDITENTAQQPRWVELARHVVSLCMSCFIDAQSGAIREYFDVDWRPMADDSGRILEPGHQFEWAWLLLRWGARDFDDAGQRAACMSAAQRLIDLAERSGVDPDRNVAMNEIWDDLTVKDPGAKLWPQTERVKAWCARLDQAQSAGEAELACRHLLMAGRGLTQYLHAAPAGLWREGLAADRMFAVGPSKASSLYHIVCAIDVLTRTAGACRANMLYFAPANPAH